MHQARCADAGEQRGRAGEVDDVIHVVAVPRALLVADARQGPIQAVTEPVARERHDEGRGAPRRLRNAGKTPTGHGHRQQGDERQMIGRDPWRQPPCDSDEQPLFGAGQQTAMFPGVHTKGLHQGMRKPSEKELTRSASE